MKSGINGLTAWLNLLGSTPIMFGPSCPIWFMTWWVIWAMERPVSRVVGNEFHGSRLTDGDQNGCFRPSRASGDQTAISLRHPERVSMQMDRVVINRPQIDAPDADAVAALYNSGSAAGNDLALKVRVLKPAKTLGSGLYAPGVRHDDRIVISFPAHRAAALPPARSCGPGAWFLWRCRSTAAQHQHCFAQVAWLAASACDAPHGSFAPAQIRSLAPRRQSQRPRRPPLPVWSSSWLVP